MEIPKMGNWKMAIEIDQAETEAIAKRIKDRMDKIGVKHEDLAVLLNVTPDTISRLLRGETVKRWIYLAKVARVLRTSPNDLLGVVEQDRARLKTFLDASYRGLGLSSKQAQNFATIFLEALGKKPDPDEPVPEEELLRLDIKNARIESGSR
jgi:transcriptional regulator with XRE-family HTH domain